MSAQAFLLAAKVQAVVDGLDLSPSARTAIEDVLDEFTPTPTSREAVLA